MSGKVIFVFFFLWDRDVRFTRGTERDENFHK